MIRGRGTSLRSITITIAATQTSLYNLFTAAGSPTDKVIVNLTINTGVVLQAGLQGTGFATGSKIYITNNGTIAGTGGAGGGAAYPSGIYPNYFSNGAPGNGGTAVLTNVITIIDNTSGNIYGGGGGGGGGGSSYGPSSLTNGDPYVYSIGAGSGGGGQGYNNAAPGNPDNSIGGTYPGAAGTSGSSTAPGTGGIGATVVSPTEHGGNGADGGGWGQSGGGGESGTYIPGYYPDPMTGGLGGYAVNTQGGGLTWIAGNNGTQVKGTAV